MSKYWLCHAHSTPNFFCFFTNCITYLVIITFVCSFYSVILKVAVYSDDNAISGERISALINQNKETFSLAINDAVAVGKLLLLTYCKRDIFTL